jgi:hypothetical protein
MPTQYEFCNSPYCEQSSYKHFDHFVRLTSRKLTFCGYLTMKMVGRLWLKWKVANVAYVCYITLSRFALRDSRKQLDRIAGPQAGGKNCHEDSSKTKVVNDNVTS